MKIYAMLLHRWKKMPNKAIESAPGGRPTHKVRCTLFAAHR